MITYVFYFIQGKLTFKFGDKSDSIHPEGFRFYQIRRPNMKYLLMPLSFVQLSINSCLKEYLYAWKYWKNYVNPGTSSISGLYLYAMLIRNQKKLDRAPPQRMWSVSIYYHLANMRWCTFLFFGSGWCTEHSYNYQIMDVNDMQLVIFLCNLCSEIRRHCVIS